MKTSFINNILYSQPILITFALKLFVCKYLSLLTHLLHALRLPLILNVNHLALRKAETNRNKSRLLLVC